MFPKFSLEIFSILSEKFPQTYFVGGAVRNVLLNKKIVDVDLATSALPQEVSALLFSSKVKHSKLHQKLGIIVAELRNQKVEIATFRKEKYTKSRFPQVSFTGSVKLDSNRRDFTVNALYYQAFTHELLDFHGGVIDLFSGKLNFIGNPSTKISEDPLRIIRALKYSSMYNLKLSEDTIEIIFSNLNLLKTISKSRLEKEIKSVRDKKIKNFLEKVIHSNT